MSCRKFSQSLIVALCVAFENIVLTGFADELDLTGIAELHRKDAVAYAMYLDSDRTRPLELQRDPILKWQNLTSQGGQLGAVYVWSRDGRPEVLGTIFSQPERSMRNVLHEFHTLAQSQLTVDSPAANARPWKPKGTLRIIPLESADDVADTAVRRLTQMRTLSREFSTYTQKNLERVELRLAPQPLIRYQPTQGPVKDGALFAFLSSAAGTDPEVLLMLEARTSDPTSSQLTWHLGIIRFTERDLVVSHKQSEVYSSITNPMLKVKIEKDYKWCHTPDDTYFVFHARYVPELTRPSVKE